MSAAKVDRLLDDIAQRAPATAHVQRQVQCAEAGLAQLGKGVVRMHPAGIAS